MTKTNVPLEIEYKYLIRYPDIEVLSAQSNYRRDEICQIYLMLPKEMSENGQRCRIRCAKGENSTRYTQTFKSKVSGITRVEIESEITEAEFNELRKYKRDGYSPILKERHTFCYGGFKYEVDIFPFWQDRAYMEIELPSDDIIPPIPDFISVIKDVSTDGRYNNSSLAQCIITEEI